MEIKEFFLVVLSVVLGARLLGGIAERAKIPAVIGEIGVGILLGPSLIGFLSSDMEVLHLLAELGVAVLLFEIGLEIELDEFIRRGIRSLLIALIGVVFPFLFGYLLAYLFYPTLAKALPDGANRELFSTFVGATLTATSVGITARVLKDLGKLHSLEGSLILGAAVVDDLIGILILSVVSTIVVRVQEGVPIESAISFVEVGKMTALAVVFFSLAIFFGKKYASSILKTLKQFARRDLLVVVGLSFLLLFALLAYWVGSAFIVGSFTAGLLLGTTDEKVNFSKTFRPIHELLVPFFFVQVGVLLDLSVFFSDSLFLWFGLFLLFIGILGKLLAGFGTFGTKARFLPVGIGMIPRGEVGLIFAQTGLAGGVISSEVYGSIMVMVLGTTLLAPFFLKFVFSSQSRSG